MRRPRPRPKHANASSTLTGDLNAPFDRKPGGPGGWWIIDEPELHLGSDVLVPDLAGWRRERMPKLPTEEAFFALPPDWVCEVFSPGTERIDRAKKKRIYLREGVSHLWLVNLLEQTLDVYCRAGEFWQEVDTYAGDQKVRAVPFDAVELDMARWWDVG